MLLAGFLFYKINGIQTQPATPLIITATPFPTIPAGFLYVPELSDGAGANVTFPNGNTNPLSLGQIPVAPGTEIDVTKGVISIGLPDGSALILPKAQV